MCTWGLSPWEGQLAHLPLCLPVHQDTTQSSPLPENPPLRLQNLHKQSLLASTAPPERIWGWQAALLSWGLAGLCWGNYMLRPEGTGL